MSGWTYQAQVVRVVDGDTVDLDVLLGRSDFGPSDPAVVTASEGEAVIDLGFYLRIVVGPTQGQQRVRSRMRFRLLDYNAPEVHGEERPMGLRAAIALQQLLPIGAWCSVTTEKGDSFGRWLARVRYAGTDVAEALKLGGWGVAWDGRGDRPRFSPTAGYPLTVSRSTPSSTPPG